MAIRWGASRLKAKAVRSRSHPLRGFPGCQVLRDDELGGSKRRKYLTLVPTLQGVLEVVLRGGPTSHNVLALALLLRESGIKPIYFQPLRGRTPGGIFALTREVLGDGLHPVEAERVEEAIAEYARREGVRVVAEGASEPAALPGALTLADQVAEGEWKQVFVDSGTGMMAAAVVLGLAARGRRLPVHVVDLTGDFERALQHWLPFVEAHYGVLLRPGPYAVHRPPVGASFGSQPAAVRREITRLAQEEGFLADPVYSAKLFLTARPLARPGALLIHSGGVFLKSLTE